MDRVGNLLTVGTALILNGLGCSLYAHQFATDWEGALSRSMIHSQAAGALVFQVLGAAVIAIGLSADLIALRRWINLRRLSDGRSSPWA
jgi:hypothetical protein